MAYQLGMISSPDDPRDYTVPDTVMCGVPVGPVQTKYRPLKSIQWSNDCGPQAMAQWMQANILRKRGVIIPYSPSYAYGLAFEGQWKGEGVMTRELLKNVTRHGIVRRALFDSDQNVFKSRQYFIDELAKVWRALEGEGNAARIRGFVRLRTIAEVHAYMTTFDLGILYGQTIYESYFQTKSDGMVPPASGNPVGGHLQYAPDLVLKNGEFRIATQNTWANFGDDQMNYIDIAEQKGVEMWGPLPDDQTWYADMPDEIIFVVPAPGGKRNDYMYVGNKQVAIPMGPFYAKNELGENKLCAALREPFEASGSRVDYQRMPDNSSMVIVRPRKGGEFKELSSAIESEVPT